MHFILKATYGDFDGMAPDFLNDSKNDQSFENITELMASASHSPADTFISCSFKSLSRDCSRLFKTLITSYGVCSHFPGGNSTDFLVQESGSPYGLTLYMQTRPEEYSLGVTEMSIGFKV